MANPVSTDQYPNSIATDPSGKFLYVTNFNTNSVRAYTIDPVTGNPDQPIGDLSYGAGTGPDCVSVESAYGRFVYVSNYLSNTVSGFELNPQTGRTGADSQQSVPHRQRSHLCRDCCECNASGGNRRPLRSRCGPSLRSSR